MLQIFELVADIGTLGATETSGSPGLAARLPDMNRPASLNTFIRDLTWACPLLSYPRPDLNTSASCSSGAGRAPCLGLGVGDHGGPLPTLWRRLATTCLGPSPQVFRVVAPWGKADSLSPQKNAQPHNTLVIISIVVGPLISYYSTQTPFKTKILTLIM